ncbi:MAG: hypothetical protein JWO96_36 [Candidatus Saccharibacteria bacterium]|nr:hypothetical protein [Candidatus Saccharibacteria bacterium]
MLVRANTNRYQNRADFITKRAPLRSSNYLNWASEPLKLPSAQSEQTDSFELSPPPTDSFTESAAAAASVMDDQMQLSIKITIPDYTQWRITKFIKQYPYLSIIAAGGTVMVLALLLSGLILFWHLLHKPVTTYALLRGIF